MFNREQLATHLRLLGKSPVTTRLRFIDPSGRSVKCSADDLETIERLSQTHNTYLVVNSGGDRDAEITDCRAVFVEWDDRPIDWQLTAWEQFGLPEPSFQVSTGGKSVHSYWVLSEPQSDVGAWKQLQSDLLAFCDGDRSIKNASRVMRLAGFTHQKTGKQSSIINANGDRYSFEDLRSIIPHQSSKPKQNTTPSQPVKREIDQSFDSYDPYRFLSRAHKSLVDSGLPTGGRNDSGCGLAKALRGIENTAKHYGLQLTYDPKDLWVQALGDRDASTRENEILWETAKNADFCQPLITEFEKRLNIDIPKLSPIKKGDRLVITTDPYWQPRSGESVYRVKNFSNCIAQGELSSELLDLLKTNEIKKITLVHNENQIKAIRRLGFLLHANKVKIGVIFPHEIEQKNFFVWCGLMLGKLTRKATQIIKNSDLVQVKNELQLTLNMETTHNTPKEDGSTSYYLPDLTVKPGTKLLILKAPCGVGKTEQLSRLLPKFKGQNGLRLPALYLVHRESLSQGGSRRLGIPHIGELAQQGILPHDSELGCCLNIDSLRLDEKFAKSRFDVSQWRECVAVIDEAEQVFSHLLFSGTLKRKRVDVFKNLAQLTRNVSESEHGLIILLDQDLSDLPIEMIEQLSGGKINTSNTEIIHVEPIPKNRVLNVFESPEDLMIHSIEQQMEGQKIIRHLSAQKESSLWSTYNVHRLIQKRFSDKNNLIIDSHTVRNPAHPAFCAGARINALTPMFDSFCVSPTLETGVDIHEKGVSRAQKISRVGAIHTGLQTLNGCLQTGERVRSDVPRDVYLPKKTGLGLLGNGSVIPYLVRTGELTKSSANESLSEIAQGFEPDPDLDIFFKFWERFAARINAQKADYRDSYIRECRANGYQVNFIPAYPKSQREALKTELKEIRDSSWSEKNLGVSRAEEIPDDKAYQLETKEFLSREETWSLQKHRLGKRYVIEQDKVTPEIDKANDDGSYSKMRLHYLLTFGDRILQDRDDIRTFKRKTRDRSDWLPDRNKELFAGKINAFKVLGIDKFLLEKTGQVINEFDPDLTAIRDLYAENRNYFNDVLGCSFGAKILEKPIKMLSQIIAKLGFELAKPDNAPERIFVQDKRIRQYVLKLEFDEIWGDRLDLFDRWLNNDLQYINRFKDEYAAGQAITKEQTEAHTLNPEMVEPDRVDQAAIDQINPETDENQKQLISVIKYIEQRPTDFNFLSPILKQQIWHSLPLETQQRIHSSARELVSV